VILSVVPKGQRVRILEIKGPWCRVDVEGKLYGKGWIYGEYLEGFAPNGIEAEPLLQPESDEDRAKASMQNLNPVAESFDAPKKGIKSQTADVPAVAKVSDSSQKEQIAIQNEQQKLIVKNNPQPRVKPAGIEASVRVPSSSEQPILKTKDENVQPEDLSFSGSVQAPGPQQPELMQKEIQEPQNSPILPSQQDAPKILKPAHPVDADLKQSTSGKHIRPSSGVTEVTEQPTAAPDPIKLSDADTKQIETTPLTSATIDAKVETKARAGAASLGLTPSPFRRTKLTNRQVTMGPFEMVLKLLSVVLACFVILLLHRSNKIATNRYEALMYVQGLLEKRQSDL
jgi:hypothetical protein